MDKIKMNSESTHEPSSLSEKRSTLEKVPFWMLSILLIILPIFIIPSGLTDLLSSKMLLFTTVVLISAAIALFAAIKSGKISLPSWKTAIVFIAVPLVSIVSAFFSIHPPSSFIGSGAEFDTVHFIGLGFVLLALVAIFFQSKQRIFWSYLGVLAAFVLVSLFHLIRFIGGPGLLDFGGAFSNIVTNTVGTWNDLSIYSGLAIILSFVTIEFVDVGRKLKWAFYATLVLGLMLLGVTNFNIINGVLGMSVPLTFLVGLIALFVFVYIISLNYRSTGSAKKMPVASLIVLVFCVIMTVGSGAIATSIYSKIGISGNDVLDVRPTIQGTYGIAKEVVTKSGAVRALLGVGPNRFYAAWGLFKPAEVNQTVFWNTDFDYGAGYVLTTIVTTGILGFLAWLFFLVTTFWVSIHSVFVGTKDKFSVYITVSSLLASLYLWIILFFSTATITTIVFAFFFTGLLTASLIREKVIKVKEYSWVSSQKKGFVAVFALIIVIVGLVAWAFSWAEHYVAAIEINEAGAVLQSPQDIPRSEGLIASAIQHAPSYYPYLRAFSQAKLVELQSTMQQSGATTLDASTTQPILEQAVSAAETATQEDPTDYRNYLFLGQVYQTAGMLGINKAGDAALNAYKQADTLIPTSPLPAYLAGYLYAIAKDPANAEIALQQALTLKPDFQEANTLYSQIDQANPNARATSNGSIQVSSPGGATATSTKSTTVKNTAATSTTAVKKK